jgi:endoglucanase
MKRHLGIVAFIILITSLARADDLRLTPADTLETQGLSVLLFHNSYHDVFGDQKMSGVELILHDQRIATNGDVRLSSTPAQWDAIPHCKPRRRGPAQDEISALCTYERFGFTYHIDLQPEPGGFRLSVQLDQPIPASLAGRAGLNLEFLPTAYFGKTFILDNAVGIFPRHPGGPMHRDAGGSIEPDALATGREIVLSPEDPHTRVTIASDNPVMLYDGRNQVQNGWFVIRSLIPTGKSGTVITWHVHPNVVEGYLRPPVVAFNQVGYTPQRSKVAVVELDRAYQGPGSARVLRLSSDGELREAFKGEVKSWGKWMRYQYALFDFSSVREPGIYTIEYAGQNHGWFRIADDVYAGIWHSSLDTYLPEQMDHVKVREGYRIWHGLSHMDDARQAPVNYTHFDGYAQGATTDSSFQPGEHIPGINVGGWFDAGDFDLRTQTHSRVITDLVLARESFGLDWDDTTIDEKARSVQIRRPDGIPDAIQQIEHGVLLLLAQYKVFGHAIPGIVEPTLEQYTHLGDAASKTDGRIYSAGMNPMETDGVKSGIPDDRWAFTTHTTPLNYNAIGALAAASRVLRGFNDNMAEECLRTAIRVWNDEQKSSPALFHSFNTTGDDVRDEEIKATVELLIATKGGEIYRTRLRSLVPVIAQRFSSEGWTAVRALPFMDERFKDSLAAEVRAFKSSIDESLAKNPYGVPIGLGTWGGSGQVTGFAIQMYYLHHAFPEVIGPEYTLRAFDYVLGRHPVSNVSYISGVGTNSKLIGYGNNRADYTFIPGGMIPGVVIIQPDFPELKDAWPFLWYENEYVVDAATGFILTANAAAAETKSGQ